MDYAEVLRERDAGIAARWDAIIAHCLQGDAIDLDDEGCKVLLEIAGDAERLADLAAQISSARARGRAGPDRGVAPAVQAGIAAA